MAPADGITPDESVPETGPRRIDPEAAARYTDPALAAVAPYVDAGWYHATYRDIAAAGLDPVEHYARFGWREGRRPNPNFDPAWYRAAYPDIRDAEMDPLRHYVEAGFQEGRRPTRPADAARATIERARREVAHVPLPAVPADAPQLSAFALRRLLEAAGLGARGCVLSVSHDDYTTITGGIQLVIADEARLFGCARFVYLHIAPTTLNLRMLADSGAPFLFQVVLNGRARGVIEANALREALAASALPARRLFVVHSFLGHRASLLLSLAAAFGAATRLVWMHDHAALCTGFNLLRNNLAYCGAPPADSHACMMCAHGGERVAHLRRVRQLHAGLDPIVIAPSKPALDLFRARANLPHRRAVAHPNAVLVRDGTAPVGEGKVRVAFVGYPMAHKGWNAFAALLDAEAGRENYAFHHFAVADALVARQGLRGVAAQAGPNARMAMRDALMAGGIELVLVLSPWPETFSFVTFEAIAAGAAVVCLAGSGNVEATVRAHGAGVVLEDEAALRAFFAGDGARALARGAARRTGTLRFVGTSATFDPEGDGRPPAELATTEDPGLRVLAKGGVLEAAREGAAWRFALPENAGIVRLISRSDLDGRGVHVAALRLDGEALALDDARLGGGWGAMEGGAMEGGARWTDGDAALEAGAARRLELDLRPGPRYPLLPLDRD